MWEAVIRLEEWIFKMVRVGLPGKVWGMGGADLTAFIAGDLRKKK